MPHVCQCKSKHAALTNIPRRQGSEAQALRLLTLSHRAAMVLLLRPHHPHTKSHADALVQVQVTGRREGATAELEQLVHTLL